jgi:hypothetical protein
MGAEASQLGGVVRQLKQNDSSVTEVWLKREQHEKVSIEEMETLCRALRFNTRVSSLRIEGEIDAFASAATWRAFADMLHADSSITEIALVCIGAQVKQHMCVLVDGLRRHGTLQELDLTFAQLDAASSDLLVAALLGCAKLRTLRMGGVSGWSVAPMCTLVREHSSLTKLDMRSADVSGDDLRQLMRALESNTHITWLNLSTNRIGDEDASVAADMLRKNSTLQYIDLGYNEIGVAGVSALATAMHSNRSLNQLILTSNRISVDDARALDAMLQRNRAEQSSLVNSSVSASSAAAVPVPAVAAASSGSVSPSPSNTLAITAVHHDATRSAMSAPNASAMSAVAATAELSSLRAEMAAMRQRDAEREAELARQRAELTAMRQKEAGAETMEAGDGEGLPSLMSPCAPYAALSADADGSREGDAHPSVHPPWERGPDISVAQAQARAMAAPADDEQPGAERAPLISM